MTIALLIVTLVVGGLVLAVAASPDPALYAAIVLASARVIGWWPLREACEALCKLTGGRRLVEANPDPAALDDIDVPVFRPTAVGRWFGRLDAAIRDRQEHDPFFELYARIGLDVPRRFTGPRLRRELDGATWRELHAEGLLPPGVTAEPGSILRTLFDLEATRPAHSNQVCEIRGLDLTEEEADAMEQELRADGYTRFTRTSLGPRLVPAELVRLRREIEAIDDRYAETLKAHKDADKAIAKLRIERLKLEAELYGARRPRAEGTYKSLNEDD